MSRRDIIESLIKYSLLVTAVACSTYFASRGGRLLVDRMGLLSAGALSLTSLVWVMVLRRRAFRATTYWVLVAGVSLLGLGYLSNLQAQIWQVSSLLMNVGRVIVPVGMVVTTVGLVFRIEDHRVAYEELEKKEEQFRRLSVTDSLTGLFNSKHFFDLLETEMGRALRYGRELSLAFLDIDNFKTFNDQHGHLEGDRLLRQVADVIRDECRENDTAFRYGGEEFTILLPETSLKQAVIVAHRIKERVETKEHQLRTGGCDRRTVSIGVATHTKPQQTLKEFIDDADKAMYRAKLAGKNRVFTAPAS